MSRFRVWHIPQVPMKAFKVEVASLEEAVLISDTLDAYDLFEYRNHVKPDYANAGGIEEFDELIPSRDEWNEVDAEDVEAARQRLVRA